MRSLVSSVASVHCHGEFGRTSAIRCSWNGHSDILQFLLEQGANADRSDYVGWTPLHFAAMHNKYECAAVLLRHGVMLDNVTIKGETALWFASMKGHLPIVQLLVQSGADIEIAQLYNGKTPIVIAREKGHTAVVAYLAI